MVEVLMAVAVLALLLIPLTNLGFASRRSTASAEQVSLAVALAESTMEELLAAGPSAWSSEALTPVPDSPEFQRAVEVIPRSDGLREIRVSVRWGREDEVKHVELVTFAALQP